ncbi:OmpA family protein [Lysobacter enzymogenes]|uniref:OmpA family protein n=1 Tax=Lysobacter enzymogenes TaxID=69 RepID=UPI0019D12EDB|nr:OmpA family protein [Lysobacter enzymogenes]
MRSRERIRCLLFAAGLACVPASTTAAPLDIPSVEFQPGRPRQGETLEQSLMPARAGRPTELENLQRAALLLQTHKPARFEVAGHADKGECAEPAQCDALSQRRAQLVLGYLIDHGIDARRLLGLTGYGAERPIVTDPRPGQDRSLNRRVEFNEDV